MLRMVRWLAQADHSFAPPSLQGFLPYYELIRLGSRKPRYTLKPFHLAKDQCLCNTVSRGSHEGLNQGPSLCAPDRTPHGT
ncbi:hypothetical protein [Pasteuria penetrans]|uniref:hypothetical protein n=1 Tax=Pasteuria penetrans TaxID=86005 RepID=UPI0011EE0DD6|nr:hypothetical protein [Pasteuria penetrans]